MNPFEAERSRLFGIAYRMLGTPADAEDVVQEAWLRWDKADTSAISNSAAWLTTVTTRLCIDQLRVLKSRREDYVGPWLSEPVSVVPTPEQVVELEETLTLGFLTVLDRLSPTDRAVFLLHDIFGHSYADVAEVVDKSEATCRQIAHRARERVRSDRPPLVTNQQRSRDLLNTFLVALASGEVKELEKLLAEDVVLVSDGGAHARAARRPVVTPARVARLLINLAGRIGPEDDLTLVDLNGQAGLLASTHGSPHWLFTLDADLDGKIVSIWTIRSPEKLEGARQALI